MSKTQEKPTLKQLISKALSSAQQEMELTLPQRLLLAFNSKAHEKDIDPDTDKPFTSFYRWLWLPPPPGVGLCSMQHLDTPDIIRQLEKCRDRCPERERGPLNALIEDLVKGNGASKGKGGRPKKNTEENLSIDTQVSNGRGGSRSKTTSALLARLAESTEPMARKAWDRYLRGELTATAAAAEAGLIKGKDFLAQLRYYWKKASKEERKAFLKFIKEEEQ